MTSLSTTLKESWTLVEEHQDKVAQYFYARIFLSDPRLRDLFPVQLDVQRARLLGAIVTAVQTIEDPERFDEQCLDEQVDDHGAGERLEVLPHPLTHGLGGLFSAATATRLGDDVLGSRRFLSAFGHDWLLAVGYGWLTRERAVWKVVVIRTSEDHRSFHRTHSGGRAPWHVPPSADQRRPT